MYGDIKGTRMFKKIKAALLEASQDWLRIKRDRKINRQSVRNYSLKVENIVDQFSELVDDKDLLAKVNNCDLEEGLKELHLQSEISGNMIKIPYMLKKGCVITPYINNQCNLELPLQREVTLQPNEVA